MSPPSPPFADAISTRHLDAVERPIAVARGMPNAAYTEMEYHRFERDHVLGKTWTALAFCADHAREGAVAPVDFMGLPLLIVHRRDGELAVFHNVCSHRGRRLVDAPKQTNGLLVCPYHAWCYDLDGALKATPHIGGVNRNHVDGFERARHSLKAVRSHCWMGVLFINLSGDAPEFEQHAAPLIARYARFIGARGEAAMTQSKSDHGLSFEADCNWKLAVENYCEAYHLPWVHPSLNAYSPLERHYCMSISDDFAGQGTNTFAPLLDGDSLPLFPEWPADQREIAEYPTFYPNLLLGYQVNHFYALIIHPLSPERVREEARFFYIGDGADAERYDAGRKSNLEAWRTVFAEDIGAIEGMQLGRRSPGFQGGVFSPEMDAPTHHFHRWIARKYRAATEAETTATEATA
ncbi:MAG: aromatic ring-hydroxylating oxygenase subunit alpha [bacterium]